MLEIERHEITGRVPGLAVVTDQTERDRRPIDPGDPRRRVERDALDRLDFFQIKRDFRVFHAAPADAAFLRPEVFGRRFAVGKLNRVAVIGAVRVGRFRVERVLFTERKIDRFSFFQRRDFIKRKLGQPNRCFAVVRGIIGNQERILRQAESRIAVVARRGERYQIAVGSVRHDFAEPSFSLHTTAGEDRTVRQIDKIRSAERFTGRVPGPVGKRFRGASEPSAAVTAFAPDKNRHRAVRSKQYGRLVRTAVHRQWCGLFKMNTVSRLHEPKPPVGGFQRVKLIEDSITDSGAIPLGLAPSHPPEPVEIRPNLFVDLHVGRVGKTLPAGVGKRDLRNALRQNLINVDAPAHRYHDSAVRRDRKFRVAQVEGRFLKQRDRFPFFPLFRPNDSDRTVPLTGFFARNMSGPFTKGAIEVFAETDQVGEGVMPPSIPNFFHRRRVRFSPRKRKTKRETKEQQEGRRELDFHRLVSFLLRS